MAERISWTQRDSLGVVLCNAMSAVAVGKDFFDAFRLDIRDHDNASVVDVVVTANGVEIPFKDEMKRTMERLEEQFNDAVQECAKHLLAGSRLSDLANKLERVEWEIAREIERAAEAMENPGKTPDKPRPLLYRGWINQPSTQQPLYRLHGKHCIVEDTGDRSVTLHFTEGDVHSMTALRGCVSRVRLSAAESD